MANERTQPFHTSSYSIGCMHRAMSYLVTRLCTFALASQPPLAIVLLLVFCSPLLQVGLPVVLPYYDAQVSPHWPFVQNPTAPWQCDIEVPSAEHQVWCPQRWDWQCSASACFLNTIRITSAVIPVTREQFNEVCLSDAWDCVRSSHPQPSFHNGTPLVNLKWFLPFSFNFPAILYRVRSFDHIQPDRYWPQATPFHHRLHCLRHKEKHFFWPPNREREAQRAASGRRSLTIHSFQPWCWVCRRTPFKCPWGWHLVRQVWAVVHPWDEA